MTTVRIEDTEGWKLRNLDYPLDWEEIADLGLRPQLVITLSYEETRELLAALESAYRGRYSQAEATAHLSISSSALFYRFKNQDRAYYSHSLDAYIHTIRSYKPFDIEPYETAPDEWVSWEYRQSKYGDHYYWYRANHINIEMMLYGDGEPGLGRTYAG